MREERGKAGEADTTTYTYDENGNRTKMERSTGTKLLREDYTYDRLDRLLEKSGTEGTTGYTYDRSGNQLTRTTTGAKTETQAGTKAGTKTEVQTYDALNRLISWTDGSKKAAYTYYQNNDRATKTVDGKTTRHIWSDGEIQVDKTDGETVDYIHGHRLIESGYGVYLYNVHGDVVQLVKGDQVTERYDYDAYGVPVEDRQTAGKRKEKQGEHKADAKPEERGGNEAGTAGQKQRVPSGNPYRYAGEYRDAETGYIYLRARFYDPDLGRFLNADPAKHGTNWYAYAGGNPVRYTDPSGLFFKQVLNGIKNTGKKVMNSVKSAGKVIQSAASVAGKRLKEFASTNVGKVVIGVTVIALAGVVTAMTGGLAGGLVGNIAYGFFTGALMGGAMGAATGGTEAVLSNRMETGSWSGSMQAFTDGAASGFYQGTISGGMMGSFGAGAKYGMKALGKGLNPLFQRVRTGKGVSGAGTKYSPINPCDKISQEVAESFRGATFTEKILTEDTIMYRVSGGKAGNVGSYLSKTPQRGGLQSQLDLALNPSWGNTTENVTKAIVPKGTMIYEGVAAPQNILDSLGNTIGTLPGGGNQIYIPKVEVGWFK